MYDKDYFENGKTTGKSNYEDYSWERLGGYFRETAEHIVEKFSPKTALDVGCAKGFLVKALSELDIKARGIDISEYAIENAHPDVRRMVKLGDVTKLPYKDAEFDVVTCFDVMEHIPTKDATKALKEMLRVAKKHIVVRVVTEEVEGDLDSTHETIHDKKWWEKKIKAAGGVIESVDKYVDGNVWWFNVPKFLLVIKKPD